MTARPILPGQAESVLPDRAGEDLDPSWGGPSGGDDDERHLDERPPHWER